MLTLAVDTDSYTDDKGQLMLTLAVDKDFYTDANANTSNAWG